MEQHVHRAWKCSPSSLAQLIKTQEFTKRLEKIAERKKKLSYKKLKLS
jgi:hypothetical protein